MKIQNVGTETIFFSDIRIPAFGTAQPILNPGQEALLYDEDAERSDQLIVLIENGQVAITGPEEPHEGAPTRPGVVKSIRKLGEIYPLTGSVYLEQGSNITLTQDTNNRKIRISSIGGGVGGNFIDNEEPSGPVNNSNRVFTLANVPITGSLHLEFNGLKQYEGASNDYQIVDNVVTYNVGCAPTSGILRASYRY